MLVIWLATADVAWVGSGDPARYMGGGRIQSFEANLRERHLSKFQPVAYSWRFLFLCSALAISMFSFFLFERITAKGPASCADLVIYADVEMAGSSKTPCAGLPDCL